MPTAPVFEDPTGANPVLTPTMPAWSERDPGLEEVQTADRLVGVERHPELAPAVLELEGHPDHGEIAERGVLWDSVLLVRAELFLIAVPARLEALGVKVCRIGSSKSVVAAAKSWRTMASRVRTAGSSYEDGGAVVSRGCGGGGGRLLGRVGRRCASGG